MNERIKRLWVEALRSGKYEQGYGELRRRSTYGTPLYCCLGVLEEIRVAETGSRFSGGRGENRNLLSDTTREWAGLDTNDPVLLPKKQMTAAELNDDGKSFEYIASKIERYL